MGLRRSGAIDGYQVPGEGPPGLSHPEQVEYDESIFHSGPRRLLASHGQIQVHSPPRWQLQPRIE